MKISIKRDGLTLRGELLKVDAEKSPVAVIFHGLMSHKDADMFCDIADALLQSGISVVKFDFNGHGESDGDFSDMNVYMKYWMRQKLLIMYAVLILSRIFI